MAITTQALRYGWVALTSLGVLTGGTIYVLNNTRKTVKPEDVIEIVLGTYERCLATQMTTNPTYIVSPLDVVEVWYSNVYSSGGVVISTATITNTIGWGISQSMIANLDAKIRALVPLYAVTSTIYAGATSPVLLTVTGLWASLGIGDRTNKFTRTPAVTNITTTNWLVSYTNYYPDTTTPVLIAYTSHMWQAVNYAYSFNSNGYLWTNVIFSNAAITTVVVEATFGDQPWNIYEEDLVERYKVLEALKCVCITPVTLGSFGDTTSGTRSGQAYLKPDGSLLGTWATAIENAVTPANSSTNYTVKLGDEPEEFVCAATLGVSGRNAVYGYVGALSMYPNDINASIYRSTYTLTVPWISTNFVLSGSLLISGGLRVTGISIAGPFVRGFPYWGDWDLEPDYFVSKTNYFGDTAASDQATNVGLWSATTGTVFGKTDASFSSDTTISPTSNWMNTAEGYLISQINGTAYVSYVFNYCTNKFW